MKTIGLAIGAIACVAGVGLALSNPKPESYKQYAAAKLVTYLETEGCDRLPDFLSTLLGDNCRALARSLEPQLRDAIGYTTERQNFGLFSIYRTEIGFKDILPPELGDDLPGYTIESVGLGNQFYTYRAEERS